MSADPTTVGMMCQQPYRIGVVAVVQAGMVELVGIHGVVGAVVATTKAPHIRQPPRAPSRGRHGRVQRPYVKTAPSTPLHCRVNDVRGLGGTSETVDAATAKPLDPAPATAALATAASNVLDASCVGEDSAHTHVTHGRGAVSSAPPIAPCAGTWSRCQHPLGRWQ